MFQAKNIWILHVLGWTLFISLPLTIMSREPESDMQLILLTSGPFWLFFGIYFSLFYFNLLVLIPKLFLEKKYLLYTSIFLAGLALTYISQPFENLIFQKHHRQNHHFAPEMGGQLGPPPREFPERPRPPRGRENGSGIAVDFVSLVLYVVIWVVAMAVSISRQWQLSEKRMILSEADKAQAELSFFKAQINPHFLFNTLNNIYAMAVSSSENTAPSILKLSQLMRYITEEATENYVPLADEIKCLENYIELQRLRLSGKTKVNFKVNGMDMGVQVAPLIFMTFVENAFKYGITNRHETEIRIEVSVMSDHILFYCQNQIFEQKMEEGRVGIGIINTQKRLEFLYPQRHELQISKEGGVFRVDLKLIIA